ncbi:hypothetical protein [Roseisolibacter sp. H3M3-2]|uniref:hypothetical protein n=1 Tax=Roseisolibacter sp. H3M3-2 TaxID=3031323 RepID=UPI0023DC72C9|nr:hypothetical protein [Roseisolibacter sp. H3M3-2]MDF1502965.1 hypothetical protein [Roseisolibacter sp. H3M3-2]
MPDRRYTDEEVRHILTAAAEQERTAALPAERGWSLAEVQQMGAEAGLPAASVAAAALTLERAHVPGESRLLGLPVAVSRAVPLERSMTEEDWEALVARLRETFAVEGRVRVSGPRREWRVGNLRVTHEPAGDGAVLALRTRKGDARPLFAMGALLLVMSLVVLISLAASGGQTVRALPLALFGAILLVGGALRLPAWASARGRQFDALADYARRLSAG